MRQLGRAVTVCGVLAAAACSKKPAETSPAAAPPSGAAAVEQAPPPAAHINIAAADMGGAIEELTDNYGPGFTGRRLIDGLLDPTLKIAEHYRVDVTYPQEAVISFFARR